MEAATPLLVSCIFLIPLRKKLNTCGILFCSNVFVLAYTKPYSTFEPYVFSVLKLSWSRLDEFNLLHTSNLLCLMLLFKLIRVSSATKAPFRLVQHKVETFLMYAVEVK